MKYFGFSLTYSVVIFAFTSICSCQNKKSTSEAYSKKLTTLHYEILIDARPEIVYRTMIDKDHFKSWTSIFSSTSRFEGSWDEGAKIQFLSTMENGSVSGMLSLVKSNLPNEFISLEHYGMIENGKIITEGEEIDAMKEALENYTFTKQGDQTLLKIDSDTFDDYIDYFNDTWPRALDALKAICEANNQF